MGARKSSSGPSLVGRLGLALAAPSRALAVAGRAENAGRAGSDAAAVMVSVLLASYFTEVVASAYLLAADGLGFGLRALGLLVSRAVATDLAFLVVAGLVVFAVARPRDAGRDFDLAAVAYIPVAVVKLLASLAILALHVPTPSPFTDAAGVLAYGWGGALVVLAARYARSAPGDAEAAGGDLAPPRAARVAGWGVVALASVTLIAHAAFVARHWTAVRPVVSGDPAPAFAAPKADGTGPIRTADLRGKVVLIDFWATWCGPCRESMPLIERLYQRFMGDGLVVLSVNTEGPGRAGHALDMAGRLGVTSPVLVDDGAIADRYMVTTIPHLVVVDKTGQIRAVHRGLHGGAERELADLIAELAAE